MLHYLWPFGIERYCLSTKLSPEQCWERLEARTLPEGRPLDDSAEEGVSAFLHPLGFTLRKAVRSRGLQIVAEGRFVTAAEGTCVKVRLSLPEGVLILFGLVFVALLLSLPLFGPDLLKWAVGFYGMLVFSVWWTREEGPFLLKFLRETLEAEDVTSAQVSAVPRASGRRGTGGI